MTAPQFIAYAQFLPVVAVAFAALAVAVFLAVYVLHISTDPAEDLLSPLVMVASAALGTGAYGRHHRSGRHAAPKPAKPTGEHVPAAPGPKGGE